MSVLTLCASCSRCCWVLGEFTGFYCVSLVLSVPLNRNSTAFLLGGSFFFVQMSRLVRWIVDSLDFTGSYRLLAWYYRVLPGFLLFFFGQEDLICFVVVFWCVWSRSAGLAVGGARGGGPVETIKKRMKFFHSFFFWCGHFFCRYRTDNDLTWGDGFRNGRRRWNEKPQRRRRHRRRAVTSIVVSCRPDDDDNDGDDSLLRWLVGRLSSVYDFAGRAIDVIGDSIISKRACRRPPLASLPGFFFYWVFTDCSTESLRGSSSIGPSRRRGRCQIKKKTKKGIENEKLKNKNKKKTERAERENDEPSATTKVNAFLFSDLSKRKIEKKTKIK